MQKQPGFQHLISAVYSTGGRRNVTGAITRRGYTQREVASGTSVVFRADLRSKSTRAQRKTFKITQSSWSTHYLFSTNINQTDVTKAAVKLRQK